MSISTPKRALIMAGGGLKVAFQAGVLQVWLDEAGLQFMHADGASGGCFNLAMYAQGMTGRQIADNWRSFEPLTGLSVNLQLYHLLLAPSLFTLDAYRAKVFPKWGLDWAAIRASNRSATFNYYNFSRLRLETVEPAVMDEDRLVACVSLPMWFPPVIIEGDTCVDAVFNTDANLEEAIRRGADELWIIWTVSTAGIWENGFTNDYFQIIEIAANSRLRDVLARIEANNAAMALNGTGKFGRRIEVKMLQAEVGLHYILNASADRVAEAVNQGMIKAREWCRENGIHFTPLPDPTPPDPAPALVSLRFSEVMKGYVSPGLTDYDAGFRRGRIDGTALSVHLTISTDDVNCFVTHPQHEATVTGTVRSALYGGDRPVEKGVFNLLVDTQDVNRKAMYYRLFFTDAEGKARTLLGFKDVRPAGGNSDVWTDTTTLFTHILDGYVGPEQEIGATVLAAGIISIHMLDFLQELTTFRVEGGSASDRLAGLARFGALFLGKLWDVYASRVLPVSPI